jgi:hypothetical protein
VRESNPQGSYARLFSRQQPSPIGLTFQSSGGRIRTFSGLLNREMPYQFGYTGIISQDGRIRTDDLVRPRHADSQTFLHPDNRAPSENRTRVSCMASRWVTSTPWALLFGQPNCQRSNCREHRAGVEPTLPHYGCGVFATGLSVLSNFSNGIRGT